MFPFAARASRGFLAAWASLLLGAVLSGCGGADSGRAQAPERPDEVGQHEGEVCPRQLPQREDPGHGFGTEQPAEQSPTLVPPEAAWVCQYHPADAGPGPDGDGTTMRWERVGPPHEVPAADLGRFARHLAELEPADAKRACTADLGPRWMLVHVVEADLTGVVVDDFGCRDVRMTDEPFETPPGDATQPGTVSGVLWGPEELVGDLKAVVEQP